MISNDLPDDVAMPMVNSMVNVDQLWVKLLPDLQNQPHGIAKRRRVSIGDIFMGANSAKYLHIQIEILKQQKSVQKHFIKSIKFELKYQNTTT